MLTTDINDATQPMDYYHQNLALTVLCPWLGVLAIFRSVKCMLAIINGDLASARRYSTEARNLSYLTGCVGVLIIFGYGLVIYLVNVTILNLRHELELAYNATGCANLTGL